MAASLELQAVSLFFSFFSFKPFITFEPIFSFLSRLSE